MNLYNHTKNQFISSAHPSDTVNFRVSSPDRSHPFLTMPTSKTLNEFLPACKNRLILYVHSWDTANFRLQKLDWPTHILTMPKQKIFEQLLWIFVNSYQHPNNGTVFIDLFWRNSWFKHPAVWLSESISPYISGRTLFPNIEFVQKHIK